MKRGQCGIPALLLGLLLTVPCLLGADRPRGLGDVQDVRTWSYPEFTRVVIELTRDVELPQKGLVRLAENPKAGRPERLYLDVPEVWVGRDFEAGVEIGDGLLKGVRLGQNTLRNTRLVIDLERYDHHRIFTLPSPARIVIDVYGEDRAGVSLDPSGRLPAALRPVHTVVVDPGHGGRDPGALGRGDLLEKDLNLAIAQELVDHLTARGFEALLTRDGDETVSLEERTAIAESAGGDVFISIHANASERSGTRGIEIYTLDASHERHSLDVASRENRVPAAQLNPFQRALAKIQAGELAGHSERLAALVHESVIKGARQRDRAVPDLGLKKGPFYVLFMSNMSSVLVETGFITNQKDAKLLRSPEYQSLIAEEIAAGVDRYRREIEVNPSPLAMPAPTPRVASSPEAKSSGNGGRQ